MTEGGLHFSINGDFINRTSREMAFMEDPPRITKAVELVMSCICTDQMSEGDRLLLAIKIIEGDADVVGTYPGDDYGVDVHDERANAGKLARKIDELVDKIADLKEQLRTQQEMFNLATEDIPEYKRRAINRVWRTELDGREDIFPDVAPMPLDDMSVGANAVLKSMLGKNAPEDPVQDFLEHMRSDTTDDYGWLSPTGEFHPVDWGDHDGWAADYMMEHPAQFGFTGTKQEIHAAIFEIRNDLRSTDALCEHGWILLHNPTHGTAFVSSSDRKTPTKAQREFLFDYFTKRNKPNLAKKYFETGD